MLTMIRNIARRCHNGTKGQALVFVVTLIPVLLGMAGFAIDGGNMYVNRANAQRTADAASLAGAQAVLTSSAQGTADAQTYATNNGDASATVVVSTTARAHDTVQVTSSKSVKTYFLALLGHGSTTISATAKAQVGPAGSAYGVIPWAVNDDAFVNSGYNVTVGLQPANGGGGGQFNFVSITPPGGQLYTDAIMNGVTAQILLNTNYPTNVADGSSLSAATKAAFQARITARPAETYLTATTGSPRIIFVPVIGGGNIPNPPSPVVFTGFRAFFVESVTSSNVFGRFLQVNLPAGTIGGAGVPDKGVHVLKLTS